MSTKSKTPDPQISQLQEEIKTLDENWKRALADYQNLLRRVDQDKKQFMKISNANLVARLLPSLDIIEMAAGHTQDMGVQMAAKQFHEALKEEGLEVITPAPGLPFDPNLMEAAETVEITGDQAENTLAELILKGYKIGDYILRPARVKVYKAKEEKTESNDKLS